MEQLTKASKLVQILNFAFREQNDKGELIYRGCQYSMVLEWKRTSIQAGNSAPFSAVESLTVPYRYTDDSTSTNMPANLIGKACKVAIILPINEGIYFEALFEDLPKSLTVEQIASKAMELMKEKEDIKKTSTVYRVLGEYEHKKHTYILKTTLLEDSPLEDMEYIDIQVYRKDKPNKQLSAKAPTTKAIINKFKSSQSKTKN